MTQHATEADRGWDRRQIEDLRWAALGGQVPPNMPLCTAPFSTMVVGQDLTVRPCGAGAHIAQPLTGVSWRGFWDSDAVNALRAALQSGALHQPHCASCARMLQSGLTASTPPIHDYGRVLATEGAPSRLVLLLGTDSAIDFGDAARRWLSEALQNVATVEVVANDVLRHPVFAVLMGLLRDTNRADLTLEISTRVLPEDAAEESLGGRCRGVRLRCEGKEPVPLRVARRLVKDAVVDLLVTPANWYRIPELAMLCTQEQAGLTLRVAGPEGRPPLADLPLAELRAVSFILQAWWQELGSARAPQCLRPNAFSNLLAEVAILLERAADSAQRTDPAAALAGRTQLCFPAPDHPVVAMSPWRQLTLPSFFGLAHSTALVAWAEAIVAAPKARQTVTDSAWLRPLLQRIAVEERSAKIREFLREFYASNTARPGLLQAEADAMQPMGLAEAAHQWARRLGLDRPPRNDRPFPFEPLPPLPTEAEPDVTVLVPSFRHERFIEETLASVLAQSHRNFRLLVIDDLSPDATVERARSLADPRLQVDVNNRNLGLGSSVLEALVRVRTPYVALLNSDDLFHPQRLEVCLAAFERHPRCQVVSTGIVMIDPEGHRLSPDNVSPLLDSQRVADLVQWFERTRPDPAELADLFPALLQRNFLATSSNLVCRTDFLRQHAAELRSLRYCLDWQLFLVAAARGALVYEPEALIAYRLHPGNTVWFDDGRRWQYYLEVNRVVAQSLRFWLVQQSDGVNQAERCARALQMVLAHVAVNSEIDGLALYVNDLLEPVLLEQTVRDSAALREAIARRDAGQQALLPARALLRESGVDAWQLMESLRQLPKLQVGEVQRDADASLLASARDALRWWRSEAESLSLRVGDAEFRVRELRAAHDELSAALERQVAIERAAIAQLRGLIAELAPDTASAAATGSEPSETLAAVLDRLERELRQLASRHATTQDQLSAAVGQLTEVRQALQATREQWIAEVSTLRSSREYRLGFWFWNRVPGVKKMARLCKWTYRRSIDLKARVRLSLERVFKGSRPKRRAVLAATGRFPVGSHTFVYREMLGLRHAGFDLRLFYWIKEPSENLHKEFKPLWDHAVQLQSVWEVHEKDLEHWKASQPVRLQALLDRIAAASGQSTAELEKRWELMQAYTFARMVERWGADYVHSYFFYEQSLYALVAGWLLDIPRGITAYADHMLDDWPLKLVALHVETADVVVATSKRIKAELVEIAGTQYADKIVVKPNGPDGSRFRASPVRSTPGGPFTLVSISRIDPKKGLLTLVEAVRLLKERDRDVVVHVVGEPDRYSPSCLAYADELTKRIEELGLAPVFVRHGFLDQAAIADLLSSSHLFVAPYVEMVSGDKDGIPTSILEAMASGLPVLTTDAGSILEVVTDGVEGVVVPQHDAVAMAKAVERLIDDAPARVEMGRRGRARFEREFDARHTEDRLHQRILAVLAARSDRPQRPTTPFQTSPT